MAIPIAKEVLPFLMGSLLLFGGLGLCCWWLQWRRLAGLSFVLALVAAGYMLYFFRDPERLPPPHPACVVAGADGQIMAVQSVPENTFLNTETVRISIFLSLFDVHVNRAPIAGRVAFLNYYPGRRYCTFQEKSSLYNQHSAILIEGEHTRCLVKQIVGPVARRVVYWLHLDQQLAQGERIGMMKFGSRLDIYLPQADVEVLVRKGDKVQAGRSIIAILRQHPELNAFGEQP